MSRDVIRRATLALAACAVVLLADCALHTEGATLALYAARSSAPLEVRDALGRPVEVVSLELALMAELVPCIDSVHVDLGQLGLSRAHAHDDTHGWSGVVIDVLALADAPSEMTRVPALPGRYCDVRVVFGAEQATAPTFTLRARSSDGAEHVLATEARRALVLPLAAPIELAASSPTADVVIFLDVRTVVSSVDLDHVEPAVDALRAFSEVVEHIEVRGIAASL